ncbi:energy transducer TonB [Flavobacterium sp. WC2509]|uniref:energy transducer TonB n=1 Tax=Flavobacterium sp. WC2509 TaxID=3461406 RepID=UPI0040442DAD
MITKTVSKTNALLSKTALLPLFSGLTFFMCIKSVAQEKSVTPLNSTAQTEKSIIQPVETKTIKIEENKIYKLTEVTEKPTFPGGMAEFYRLIGKNFAAPNEPNLKGKIYISFIIEKDGSLTDIKSTKDIGFGTGEEGVRVVKLSPKWMPGKIDGNPVRVSYSLPIIIALQEKSVTR